MSESPYGPIPRGVEVLVAKASVDPEFRAVLLDRRAAAAAQIGLELEPAEATMLAAVAREQLEAIIARIRVPEQFHAAFLGPDLAPMLAAVAATPDAAWEVEGERDAKPDWRRSRSTPVAPAGIRPFGIRPIRWIRRWFSGGSGARGEATPSPADCEQFPPLIERLLYNAAADADFADKLLRERSAAAASIGVTLDPADAAILNSMPNVQLAAAIEATRRRSRTETVQQKLQRVAPSRGNRPDRPLWGGVRPE